MKKSNVRHLTTALAAAAFLASSPSSSALGIGEMHLQSALNQNLKADISLILSEGEKGSDFQIGFAPNAKFDEAGIPWSVFLSKIKFKTVTENGNTVIKLTSTEVLKEPFLDFLLEIKGSKGTLYREFTVLVDPPAAYQSVKTLPESTSNSSKLPQRFVSVPTPFSSTELSATTPKTKPTPKSVSHVHHAPAIKHAPKKEKSPTPVLANPLASNAPKVTSIAKTQIEPAAQQKVIELEKQVSAMQKTIAEKDAQMVALKASNIVQKPVTVVPPMTPDVIPTPVVVPPALPPSPLIPPVILSPENSISPVITPPITVEEAIAVLPPPITPPTVIPPVAKVIPTPMTSTTVAPENYFGIPADMYYYIAGGLGSLLLGVLGWLRLRARNNAKIGTEIPPETQEIVNDDSENTDSLNEIFDDEFDMNAADFENLSTSNFGDFTKNDPDKHTTDDVLYKASVYCSYGNNELAEKLLHDEFIKTPNTHDYALYLLKLYVSKDDKEKFKDFVFELAKLGKNDLSEFWAQVSDLASDFYPEALFFTHPPAVPDPSTSIPFDEIFASGNLNEKFRDDNIDFDAMSFDDADDQEITFGELTKEEALGDESLEIQASSLGELTKKEEPVFDLNFGGFTIDESLETEALTFEMPPEKEAKVELDFSGFDFGKTPESEALAFEIPVEKESNMKLDFSSFASAIGESLETKKMIFETPVEKEPEMELDFSAFSMEKPLEPETVAFEIPTKKEPEVLAFKKSAPFKSSLDFEKVSHLVEEKIAQTYLDLATIHKEEEAQLDYLEMSDSEFAESLAAEVLEKCKIKEQLCRQRIAQEVLSKLC